MAPQQRQHESVRINPDVVPVSLFLSLWEQIEPAQRLGFLADLGTHLTIGEWQVVAIGLDEDWDRLPEPYPVTFLYRHGQQVHLHDGRRGEILFQHVTVRPTMGDIIEYTVACEDGTAPRENEADLMPVEDTACDP